MQDLSHSSTASTPEVRFEAATGLMILRGESYPENAFAFYTPLLKWLEQFLEENSGPATLELGLTYLNTSSIKSLMDLLDMLEDAHKSNRQVTVKWYYDPDNDRALEMAEEFREEVSLPFFMVAEK
jgi:hypothetical protein